MICRQCSAQKFIHSLQVTIKTNLLAELARHRNTIFSSNRTGVSVVVSWPQSLHLSYVGGIIDTDTGCAAGCLSTASKNGLMRRTHTWTNYHLVRFGSSYRYVGCCCCSHMNSIAYIIRSSQSVVTGRAGCNRSGLWRKDNTSGKKKVYTGTLRADAPVSPPPTFIRGQAGHDWLWLREAGEVHPTACILHSTSICWKSVNCEQTTGSTHSLVLCLPFVVTSPRYVDCGYTGAVWDK